MSIIDPSSVVLTGPFVLAGTCSGETGMEGSEIRGK